MSFLTNVFREIIGLFVDDGALALLVSLTVAVVAVAVKFLGLSALVGGCLLLVGCLLVLAGSLVRKTREKQGITGHRSD